MSTILYWLLRNNLWLTCIRSLLDDRNGLCSEEEICGCVLLTHLLLILIDLVILKELLLFLHAGLGSSYEVCVLFWTLGHLDFFNVFFNLFSIELSKFTVLDLAKLGTNFLGLNKASFEKNGQNICLCSVEINFRAMTFSL